MPIPLIPAAIGLASLATAGAKKSYDGIKNMKNAKKITTDAESRHKSALATLENQRNTVKACADKYVGLMENIIQTTFKQTVDILKRLGKENKDKMYKSLSDIGVNVPEIEQYKQTIIYVESMAQGGLSAFAAGAAAGPAATKAVLLFGTASTGTAIGNLSGAASTNAILAWLGGGSLASGGGGVAAGTIMLNGIALAPAIAVAGFVLSSKGQKALTKAKEQEMEINVAISKIISAKNFLESVIAHINERSDIMTKLNSKAKDQIIDIETIDFDRNNDEHMSRLMRLLQIVRAQSDIMTSPVLTPEECGFDDKGLEIVSKYKELVRRNKI